MRNNDVFIQTALRYGFSSTAAHAALNRVQTDLRQRRHSSQQTFYTYRTGKSSVGGAAQTPRPRLVIAFATADTALAFAQHNHLGPTPRLLRANLAQLLAVMVQRVTIGVLLFADEPVDHVQTGALPPGFRLDRRVLLTMLQQGRE